MIFIRKCMKTMATDKIQLQALRSKDVLNGSSASLEVAKYFDGVNSPKLPMADQLEFGEIAINIAKGYEVIAIKNYDGEIVYLPFNVATKLLSQEVSLNELKEYAYNSITELSGYTVSSFENVNIFLDELNRKIDDNVEVLVFDLKEQIAQLSGHTFDAITSITKELHSEIDNVADNATLMNRIIEERLTHKINSLSASTIDIITSFSGETDSKLSVLENQLTHEINIQKENTNRQINDINSQIVSLVTDTDVNFALVDNKINNEISGVNEATQKKINQLVQNFNISLSDLSGKTEEHINNVYNFLCAKTDDLYQYIGTSINNLSGATDGKLVSLNETLIGKINDLSASTQTTIGKVILKKINDLSAQTTADHSELKKEINDLQVDTSVKFYTTSLDIKNQINTLSGATDDKLNKLQDLLDKKFTKELQDDISSLSGNVEYLVVKLQQKINQVSGDSVSSDEEIKAIISDLSSRTESELSTIDATIDDLLDLLIEFKSETNENLNTLSAVTKNTKEDISLVDNKLQDLSQHTTEVITDLNDKIIVNKQDIINVNKTINTLSAETKNITPTLIDYTNNAIASVMDDIQSAITDVYVTIEDNGKKSSAYTDNAIAEIEDEIDDLKHNINIVSGQCQNVANDVKLFSATTEERIDNCINIISGVNKNLNDKIDETAAIQIAVTDKLNAELGFNQQGSYNPTTPLLEGKNVTEAIDLVYTQEQRDIRLITQKQDLQNIKIDTLSAETDNKISNLKDSTDIKLSEFEDYLYSEDTMHMERSVTYTQLVKMVKESKLRWGMMYRLTNYQATVDSDLLRVSTRLPIMTEGQNTNNGFDIILRATSNCTLNENARLIQSVNSNYFEDCHLESWEIKYSLFNDKSRFEWAKEDGFGVIYYMKDNYSNEASYDFKNIVFGGDRKYTFTITNTNSDASMIGKARNNIIKPCYDSIKRLRLNNVLFDCEEAVGNTILTNGQDIMLDGIQVNNMISNIKNGTNITSSYCTFHGLKLIHQIF